MLGSDFNNGTVILDETVFGDCGTIKVYNKLERDLIVFEMETRTTSAIS